jgi:hypothetical protein
MMTVFSKPPLTTRQTPKLTGDEDLEAELTRDPLVRDVEPSVVPGSLVSFVVLFDSLGLRGTSPGRLEEEGGARGQNEEQIFGVHVGE